MFRWHLFSVLFSDSSERVAEDAGRDVKTDYVGKSTAPNDHNIQKISRNTKLRVKIK